MSPLFAYSGESIFKTIPSPRSNRWLDRVPTISLTDSIEFKGRSNCMAMAAGWADPSNASTTIRRGLVEALTVFKTASIFGSVPRTFAKRAVMSSRLFPLAWIARSMEMAALASPYQLPFRLPDKYQPREDSGLSSTWVSGYDPRCTVCVPSEKHTESFHYNATSGEVRAGITIELHSSGTRVPVISKFLVRDGTQSISGHHGASISTHETWIWKEFRLSAP